MTQNKSFFFHLQLLVKLGVYLSIGFHLLFYCHISTQMQKKPQQDK